MPRNRKHAPEQEVNPGTALYDALDAEVLKILQRDGRITNREIARQLGVAEGTIRNRVRRLIENGVMAIVAVTDVSKLGYPIDVTIGLEVEPSCLLEVATALARLDQIRYAKITTGAYDILVAAYFKSKDEQLEFYTHQLANITGIRRAHTSTSLKVFKRNFEWLPLDASGNEELLVTPESVNHG